MLLWIRALVTLGLTAGGSTAFISSAHKLVLSDGRNTRGEQFRAESSTGDSNPLDESEAQRIEAFRQKLMRQSGGNDQQKADARQERRRRREEKRLNSPDSDSSRSISELLSSAAAAASASSPFAPPKEADPWAEAVDGVSVGTLLLGNPEVFCSPKCPKGLLEAVGLAQPLPLDQLGGLRVADLLPVVLVIDDGNLDNAEEKSQAAKSDNFFGSGVGAGGRAPGGAKGLLMNRRTGYLMGDLQQNVEGFMIQPLHLGGREDADKGLTMLHPYPEIVGSTALTPNEEAGPLCFGGSFEDAQKLVKRGTGSQFKFKFFVQSFRWKKGELAKQVSDGVWLPARCGKEVVLRIREREGTKRPKPLWTEVLELCGGDYAKTAKTILEEGAG